VQLRTDAPGITIEWPDASATVYSTEWLHSRDIDGGQLERHRYHAIKAKHWGVGRVQVCIHNIFGSSHSQPIQKEITSQPVSYQRLLDDDAYLRDKLVDFLSYGIMFTGGNTMAADTLGVTIAYSVER
jgi:hypothetical protein